MYRRWLYGLAVVTAVMTFILICMGGLVTSTDSGLAVPDWPTTFGYNMFLYPLSKTVSGFLLNIDSNLQADLDDSNPSKRLRSALEKNENTVSEDVRITVIAPGSRWRLTDDENGRTYSVIKTGDRLDVYVHGVLYEHSHRLLGLVVTLLTVGLMVSLLVKDDRKWMKWLGVIALAAVVAQGVMGGKRVTNLSIALAIIHACFAQAFFALTASLALFSSRGWLETSEQIEAANTSRLRNLSIITVCLIYVQFIFGAVLRHTGNRLDAHLVFAGLVTIHIFLLLRRILQDHLENRLLVRLILLLSGLLAVQLVLGFGAFVTEFTALGKGVSPAAGVAITTAHVAIGALMMVSSVLLALNVFRFKMGSEPVARQGLVSDEVSA